MRVLAQQPGGSVLVDLGKERGCIVTPDGTVHEAANINALFAHGHGYWEDFTGDPEFILARVREQYVVRADT